MQTSRDKAPVKKIGSLSFQICLIAKSMFNGAYDKFSMNIIYSLFINAL